MLLFMNIKPSRVFCLVTFLVFINFTHVCIRYDYTSHCVDVLCFVLSSHNWDYYKIVQVFIKVTAI